MMSRASAEMILLMVTMSCVCHLPCISATHKVCKVVVLSAMLGHAVRCLAAHQQCVFPRNSHQTSPRYRAARHLRRLLREEAANTGASDAANSTSSGGVRGRAGSGGRRRVHVSRPGAGRSMKPFMLHHEVLGMIRWHPNAVCVTAIDVTHRSFTPQLTLSAAVSVAYLRRSFASSHQFPHPPCSHMCMTMRGVEKPGATTISQAFTGVLKTDRDLKREFLVSVRGK